MICSKCKADKPDTEYRKRNKQCRQCLKEWHAAHYQRPEVKARHLEQGRRWRAANVDKQRSMDLKSRLKLVYNLPQEEYDAMLAAQGGGCAVCKSPDPRRKRALRLFVDHDHNTDKVRGLLCHYCNLMLGYADDSPVKLQQAIAYLTHRVK